MKRCLMSLLVLLFLLQASWSDTYWTDAQMEELEGLVAQAQTLMQQQQKDLSDLRTQLQEQSTQMQAQSRQLKLYKTLSVVSVTAAITTLVIWRLND